jgi:very-short-patch-repair endonuclease
MTDAERKLWYALRYKTLPGLRFRRQMPVGNYIVDFCCLKSKLIIEVDGGQHAARQQYDLARTRFLESRGFRVLRLWDNEVLNNLDGAVEFIIEALGQSPHPHLPPQNIAREGTEKA